MKKKGTSVVRSWWAGFASDWALAKGGRGRIRTGEVMPEWLLNKVLAALVGVGEGGCGVECEVAG